MNRPWWEWEYIYNIKEKLDFVEKIENIKVYKRKDWTYKLMFDNDKNEIIYSTLSYKLVKKWKEYIYLKIKEKNRDNKENNDFFIYKIPLNPKNKNDTIKFIAYSKYGKKEISSEYEIKENKCYISSTTTSIDELPNEEKKFIVELFSGSKFESIIKKIQLDLMDKFNKYIY